MDDLISRQLAIDKLIEESNQDGAYGLLDTKSMVDILHNLPSEISNNHVKENKAISLNQIKNSLKD